VSIWQYHPFTLTSAPEEDYISVHIRMVGNFTKAFGKALGCDIDKKGGRSEKGASKDITNELALRKILPRVYIDGPFGSASEDVFKFEIAVLVGAGIGVTPFASILKSIWYRMNYPQGRTRLRKVYFFWICRDFGSFEWFRSLLLAIEAQDLDDHIEIHTVSFTSLYHSSPGP
jgi:NADPH oxidase